MEMLKLKEKGNIGNKLLVCIVNKLKNEAIYKDYKFNVKKLMLYMCHPMNREYIERVS